MTTTGKRKVVTVSEPVTYERIAARAYELFLQRGGAHGNALEDWLTAENELSVVAPPVKKRTSKKALAMTADHAEKVSAKVTPKPEQPLQPKSTRQRKETSAPTKKTRAKK